jgi:hypothetical protein
MHTTELKFSRTYKLFVSPVRPLLASNIEESDFALFHHSHGEFCSVCDECIAFTLLPECLLCPAPEMRNISDSQVRSNKPVCLVHKVKDVCMCVYMYMYIYIVEAVFSSRCVHQRYTFIQLKNLTYIPSNFFENVRAISQP